MMLRVACAKCGIEPLSQWWTFDGVELCEACAQPLVDAWNAEQERRAKAGPPTGEELTP